MLGVKLTSKDTKIYALQEAHTNKMVLVEGYPYAGGWQKRAWCWAIAAAPLVDRAPIPGGASPDGRRNPAVGSRGNCSTGCVQATPASSSAVGAVQARDFGRLPGARSATPWPGALGGGVHRCPVRNRFIPDAVWERAEVAG